MNTILRNQIDLPRILKRETTSPCAIGVLGLSKMQHKSSFFLNFAHSQI